MLNVMNNATNINTKRLLNEDSDTINIINEQIVEKFVSILEEVKKMKKEHLEDEQFANALANDVAFDIPEVFTIDDPAEGDKNKEDEDDANIMAEFNKMNKTLHYEESMQLGVSPQSLSQSVPSPKFQSVAEPISAAPPEPVL